MLVIGVTGGIGSGKTEVCKMFAKLGVTVISADALARDIMETNTALVKRLKDEFGQEIYTDRGKLNHALLAKIVFSDKRLKEKLDAAVHPYVLREVQNILRKHRSTKENKLLVIEAALMYESGADRLLDYVIVVNASEKNRIRRVMERDGSHREEVQLRMKAQMPPKEVARKADFVINNDGELSSLENKVKFLYRLFHTMLHNGRTARNGRGSL